MPTLEELRRRIDTATSLGSVVTSMKTLAAVSIRQYERAVDALADYSRTVELGFQIVLRNQPVLAESSDTRRRTGVVLLGTDQGMCGQFNAQIVNFLRQLQREQETNAAWRVLVVGARAERLLIDPGFVIDQTYQVPTSVSDIGNLVQELLPRVDRWRTEADVSRLFVCYNRRTSASSYEPQQLQLLPLNPQQLERWREQPWQSRSLPVFATDRRFLLSRLIRQYLFAALFRACAESLASENASRIAAMQAAEKNIEDLLDQLHGEFNQSRQTAITEELQDVITGFEALAKQDRPTPGW